MSDDLTIEEVNSIHSCSSSTSILPLLQSRSKAKWQRSNKNYSHWRVNSRTWTWMIQLVRRNVSSSHQNWKNYDENSVNFSSNYKNGNVNYRVWYPATKKMKWILTCGYVFDRQVWPRKSPFGPTSNDSSPPGNRSLPHAIIELPHRGRPFSKECINWKETKAANSAQVSYNLLSKAPSPHRRWTSVPHRYVSLVHCRSSQGLHLARTAASWYASGSIGEYMWKHSCWHATTNLTQSKSSDHSRSDIHRDSFDDHLCEFHRKWKEFDRKLTRSDENMMESILLDHIVAQVSSPLSLCPERPVECVVFLHGLRIYICFSSHFVVSFVWHFLLLIFLVLCESMMRKDKFMNINISRRIDVSRSRTRILTGESTGAVLHFVPKVDQRRELSCQVITHQPSTRLIY